MVVTILEARVAADQAGTLESEYKRAIQQLDAGITQTLLVHNVKDPALWQIMTFWENRAVLDAMRNSGQTPRGVVIFRAAGVEPVLSVFDAVAYASAPA